MSPLDLLKINVNEHTEEKNGLTYLSWAWAWQEALKADPAVTFNVQLFDGKPYMEVNGTAMVWVTVTMFNNPRTCMLPVMDSYNKPITIEGVTTVNKYGKEITTKVDSFNVNTSIMRCMTKALALHGLGAYIYAGEDTPDENVKTVTVTTPKATVEMTVPASAPIPAKVESTGSSVAAVEAPKGDWTDEDAALIAETMLAFISVHRDLPDLNSYWKNNQVLLDRLKASHPETYNAIRNGFAEYKKTLQGADK